MGILYFSIIGSTRLIILICPSSKVIVIDPFLLQLDFKSEILSDKMTLKKNIVSNFFLSNTIYINLSVKSSSS